MIRFHSKLFVTLLFVSLILTACQGGGLFAPTSTPTILPTLTPTLTPTVTPTPSPQQLTISEALGSCQLIAEQKREIILVGKIILPEGTIYGYKTQGETWLGMNLVTTNKIPVLLKVGSGPGTMDALPDPYAYKDLLIRADDNQVILHGQKVRITGHLKFRDDNPDRKCEVFVDEIESAEDPEALVPIDIPVADLLNGDKIADCSLLSKTNQLVRITGSVVIDKDAVCWMNECTLVFKDNSGKLKIVFSTLGDRNSISPLTPPYRISDLKMFDRNGTFVENSNVHLVGTVYGTNEYLYCSLRVYEIIGE